MGLSLGRPVAVHDVCWSLFAFYGMPLTNCALCCRARMKCNGTCAETRFGLSAQRTIPFKSAGVDVSSVDCCAAELCVSAVVMLDTACSEVV